MRSHTILHEQGCHGWIYQSIFNGHKLVQYLNISFENHCIMQKKNPITTLSETASRSLLENRVIVEHTHKVFLVLQIHRICLLTKPSRWKCASSENHMQFTSTLLRSSISCKSFTNCFLFSMNAVWSGFYVWNLYVYKVRHFFTVI